MARPRSRPAAPEDVITESAPLSRSRWAFSASRTAETIVTPRLSSRAVRVISTAVSSRSGATTTAVALRMPACSSTAVSSPLPLTAASPAARAAASATAELSITTMSSVLVPPATRASIALLPFVPKPQTMV